MNPRPPLTSTPALLGFSHPKLPTSVFALALASVWNFFLTFSFPVLQGPAWEPPPPGNSPVRPRPAPSPSEMCPYPVLSALGLKLPEKSLLPLLSTQVPSGLAECAGASFWKPCGAAPWLLTHRVGSGPTGI